MGEAVGRRTGALIAIVTWVVALGPACGGRLAGDSGANGSGDGGWGSDGGAWTPIAQRTVDQIDLLFVIDNSSSMGDKQTYLLDAVPLLIQRLVQPNCLDANGTIVGQSSADGLGACTLGTIEFPPVHDMHIGLLSSSLGTRLSDQFGTGGQGTVCDPSATLISLGGVTFPAHNDDRAELLNRTNALVMSGDPLSDAGNLHYLSWFPTVPKNLGKAAPAIPITSATTLTSDFKSLVGGVGTYGCGIESQLESWYRFLVQPDPYDSLSLDASGNAQWVGVDTTILAERASFLRPNSLVAIIDLTDENDSEIDVRSIGGQGYRWMAQTFDPFTGTPDCAENSSSSGLVDTSATCESGDCTSSSCTSCGFQGQSCPGTDTYTAQNDWGMNENLRHVHMMQKYGVWPQFPIQRYALGLTSNTIPDRNGEYPAGAGSYQGLTNRDCTNPLFAASLPDGSSTDPNTLCNLPIGTRTPDLVYYAHIGGVPHELLQSAPGDSTCPAGTAPADCPQKGALATADWVKILGQNPLDFNYTGADPHMIESYEPRAGVPACPATPDAEGVCDWVTNTGAQHRFAVDREYACTFPLATPRDCTQTNDPSVSYACDCPSTTGLTSAEVPPLCNASVPTQQVAAKAYPTERELLLAKLMGAQGFVSSLCPIHATPSAGSTELDDPLYGYNPAINGFVGRMKDSLGGCFPESLTPAASGEVPCIVVAQLPGPTAPGACENPGSACDPSRGLYGPGVVPPGRTAPVITQEKLNAYCAAQEAGYSGGAVDPSTYPACALAQLSASSQPNDFSSGSCASSPDPGWCYVTGAGANDCSQALVVSAGEPPTGAIVSIECGGN